MADNSCLRVFVYGDIGGSGGYIRYCKGLFGSGAIPKEIEIIFVCSPSFYEQIKPLDDGIKIVHHSWSSSSSRLQRYLWHLAIYPALVRKIHPDVEFFPSGQLRVYLRKAVTVASCHNLLLFDQHELNRFTDKHQRRYFQTYRSHQESSYKRASGVIFFSEYSKRVVLGKVPELKITSVIPHGLEPHYCFLGSRTYDFGLQVNLLYVSPIYPYKNHQEVILAVKMLRKELDQDLRLRLVGGGSPEAVEKLKAFILKEEASEYINLVEFINTSELIEQYIKADIFIFASSCETFGITLLEAMAASLPIACSNRVGLPDILKDAGEYFDPEDPIAIANSLCKLILSHELRKRLGEKAKRYSQEYTWKKAAQRTFSFIRQIAEQQY